jgi:predicted nucleic acid-binding protein
MVELRAGEALGLVPACDWHWLTILQPTDEERTLAKELESRLDPGEAECLAVAQMRRCKFLSDDLTARRLALHREVNLSGTLGVLLTLVDRGHLSLAEANGLLAAMISHGYRSPVESLEELLL